ncbi:MAG: PQQ-binding-like beta-propeller repeat protein [Candidatus Bathyarchaeota archaeon]|nr:PQQ-binding-like beta-propeller repeat protein [Candidatus Bathyarchaeota archaeon]
MTQKLVDNMLKAVGNKTFTTATLTLLLAFSMFIAAAPTANAHDPPWEIPTYAYITAAPNPIGVDQTVTLVYWIDKIPPTAAGVAGDRWVDLTIDVTLPDGTTETIDSLISDPVGGGYAFYTPRQVGVYTFVFNFPEQVADLEHPTSGLAGSPSDYVNDTYLASSASTTLNVQSETITTIPDTPLPNTYWTRPIEGQNTNWYAISSNFLSGSAITNKYQPDGVAPNSPHVMWTRPISFGGVVGGDSTGTSGVTYYDGTNYEGKFNDPIIIYGRLYYSLPESDASTGDGYICVDLQTGEELWRSTEMTTSPSFAQLYDYESMNQHGVIPNGYLWTTDENPWAAMFGLPAGPTTWQAFDPLDGTWLFNLTNIPAGTEIRGPNGEILRYVLNLQNNWLALWNNTAATGLTAATNPEDTTSSEANQWRPVGKNVNASNAYTWNVTIPQLPGGSIIAAVYDDILIGSTPLASFLSFGTPDPVTVWAISLKQENLGELLWMEDISAPDGNVTRSVGPFDADARVFTFFDKETISWSGYSMDTGKKLWGSTPSENPWNFYSGGGGALTTTSVAYGKLYSTGYSGVVYCYDISTGNRLWNYTAIAGLDTPYGGYPLGIAGVADDKVYLATNEHSSGAPYWRGAEMRCINATTGNEIWTMYGHGCSSYGDYGYAIADGYLVYLNLYDMQIYCIGKGPSKVTVDAPLTVVSEGDSIMVRGTVTDQSAGAKDLVENGLFNVVPAISDADAGSWMEYLYMQKQLPTDATGVQVRLTAVDPNNNMQDIGVVTTDTSGLFKKMWQPPVPGEYTITACFDGSDSYWASSATTAVGVSQAPAASIAPTSSPDSTPPTTPTPPASASPSPSTAPPPTSETPTTTYIAVGIAVIIIVAVAAALVLRRRQ